MPTRAALVAIAVNLSLMGLQLGAGWISGSHAMQADGIHSLIDVVADGLIALSVHLALRDPEGRGNRLMPVAAALVSVLIMATGVEFLLKGILAPAVPDDGDPPRAVTVAALVVSVAGVAVKGWLYRFLKSAANQAKSQTHGGYTQVLNAGAWHSCVDAVSACIAAVGAAGTMSGLMFLDRGATALIGGLIFTAGFLQEGNPLRTYYLFAFKQNADVG